MVQSFDAALHMEVRKVEEAELEIGDKTYRYLNIHFDNDDCERYVFKDKNIDNKDKYKRGDIGTLIVTVSTENVVKSSKTGNSYISEKTSVVIKDFKKE